MGKVTAEYGLRKLAEHVHRLATDESLPAHARLELIARLADGAKDVPYFLSGFSTVAPLTMPGRFRSPASGDTTTEGGSRGE